MIKSQHSRSLLIVAIVVATVFVARISSFIFVRSSGRVDPHINLVEDRARQITESQHQLQVNAFVAVTEGEVFRTEERIRETTALATATGLFAASESLSGRVPANVAALLDGVNKAKLLPPGLQTFSDGSVTSSHAKLIVRYKPEPFGVEVVSIGKVPLDGPMLLVRIAVDGTNKERANIYAATSLEQTQVPTPFAHEAEIFALGFVAEPLRAAKLSKP
jgi:hypothetical protein